MQVREWRSNAAYLIARKGFRVAGCKDAHCSSSVFALVLGEAVDASFLRFEGRSIGWGIARGNADEDSSSLELWQSHECPSFTA